MKRHIGILSTVVLMATMAACGAIPVIARADTGQSSHRFGAVSAIGAAPVGSMVSLSDSLVPAIRTSRSIGAIAIDRQLSIVISLRVRNQAGLDSLVRQQYTPGSSQYHRWLTPTQFAARFAPLPSQRARLVEWLHTQGISTATFSRNGLALNARASALRLEQTFRTPILSYRQHNRVFFANSRALEIPASFARQVSAVVGLDNYSREQAHFTKAAPHVWTSTGSSTDPLSPAETLAGYNIQPLVDAGMHGEGQTIAVVQYTDFDDNDIASYDANFGLAAPSLQRIQVDGGSDINSDQPEAELDVEMVHSIAPAAHLLVYEAPNSATGTVDLWNQIVSDDSAPVISSSYGTPEASAAPLLDVLNATFEEAAAQGQGIFNASGDSGAFDDSGSYMTPDPNNLQVDFPASSPWVTAVGGTMLASGPAGTTEQAWGQPAGTVSDPGAGGGLSNYWQRPWYQVGPGVDNQYTTGYRQVPDVSAIAGAPGFAIYTVGDDGPEWVGIGGTSAATPLWAAYATLLNQQYGSPIGFLNPTLYALGQKSSVFAQAPFNDVTQGDNLFYPATAGWDFASGWGSMNGQALAQDVQSMSADVVHPADSSVRVWVATRSGGQFVPLQTVRRGQTVYLLAQISYTALPNGDTPDQSRFLFATPGTVILKRSVSSSIGRGAVGNSYDHWIKVKVPSMSPGGTYTFTLTYTVGGTATSASIQVQIQ